jgi:DNA-binding SARP family transcriptional activator
MINPSEESGNYIEDVQALFTRSVQVYQTSGIEPAFKELEKVAHLAQIKGNTIISSRAAALLGLILLDTGDFKGAIGWLRAAQREISNPETCHWYGMLSSLSNITAASLATEQARQIIAETQKQILEEIHQLTSEIKTKSSLLWKILISPIEKAELEILPKRKTDISTEPIPITIFVHLLGRFHVHLRDNKPLRLCSNRKGRALFMLFVSHQGQRFHRETLLDLLWQEEDPAIAVGKLHVAVSRLRRALIRAGLGEDPLIFDQSHYSLNKYIEVISDLSSFQSHAASGRELETRGEIKRAVQAYVAAHSLYQGPFLEDVVDEDWPLTLRTQCEGTLLQILDRLSYWNFKKNQYLECANYCRQLIEVDDLREDIYRRLMLCLSHTGRRNQALRCYHELQKMLNVELGVEPMRETQVLFNAILNEENSEIPLTDPNPTRHQDSGKALLS